MPEPKITRDVTTTTRTALTVEQVEEALRYQFDLDEPVQFDWEAGQGFVNGVTITKTERTFE